MKKVKKVRKASISSEKGILQRIPKKYHDRIDYIENVQGDGWCDETTKYDVGLKDGWFFDDSCTTMRFSSLKEVIRTLKKETEYNMEVWEREFR